MKYRALDKNGDYQFGKGDSVFLQDSPETVAQAVKTRLALIQGEWFQDIVEGVPYETRILGTGTTPYYDSIIQERILNTQGVKALLEYSSVRNPEQRSLSVSAKIDTIYGQTTFTF